MARDDGYTRYTVRIPTPLYERVKKAAGEKSINAEIVETLEVAYPNPHARDLVLDAIMLLSDLQRRLQEAGASEENLQLLKDRCDAVIEKMRQDPDLAGEDGSQTLRELAVLLSYLRP